MAENQVVIFDLAGVRYCIDILQVQEILRVVKITPVAEADFAVEGIINLRGQVIPIINFSRRLGLLEKEKSEETMVIVVEQNGKKAGLIVDKVLEVSSYTSDELEKSSVAGTNVTFLKDIAKKGENLWLALNLSEVA